MNDPRLHGLVIHEGVDLEDTEFEWSFKHVSIRPDGDLVQMQIGNGGDFGATEWTITRGTAREFAAAILRACE